jgi:hypothetical protein
MIIPFVAIACPLAFVAMGYWFDTLAPIEGLIDRFLFSTWPMASIGCAFGALTAAAA